MPARKNRRTQIYGMRGVLGVLCCRWPSPPGTIEAVGRRICLRQRAASEGQVSLIVA